MFIKDVKSGYNKHDEQFTHGWFLVLCQPQWDNIGRNSASEPIKAFVRYCRMSQLGNFMMGSIKVGSHKLIMSGAYGSDGLPDNVPMEVYEEAIPLPNYLVEAWKNGGGWNSAGNEAELMRSWAIENFNKLRIKLSRVKS